jgi:hypothetical protein
MATQIEKSQAQIARAQLALDEALAAGIDTTAARADLAAAEARVVDIRTAAMRAEPGDAALRLKAEQMAADAAADIQASIAEMCTFKFPVVVLDPAIAAQRLRCDAIAASEEEAARVHATKVEGLRGRLEALEGTLAEVVSRGTGGDHRPDDAERAGLLVLDIDALQKLIAKTEAATPTATNAAFDARGAWLTEWLNAIRSARQAVIAELQARLIEVATAEPRAPFGQRTKVDSRIQALIRTGVWG